MAKGNYFYCSECGDGPTGTYVGICPTCGSRAPPRRSPARTRGEHSTSSIRPKPRDTLFENVSNPRPLTSEPFISAADESTGNALPQAATIPDPPSVDVGPKVGDPVCSLTDRMDLPFLIAGKWVETMPDLGAAVNALSLATLQELGIAYTKEPVPDSKRFFRAGDSEIIEPDFRVRLECKIPRLPESNNTNTCLTFYIFKSLMEGIVIIGRKTLRRMKIYTEYRHLLTPHKETSCSIRQCLNISRHSEVVDKLPVYLNGVLAEGVADTGCHQLVMREDYARELDLHKESIDFEEGERRTVVFASGREQAAEYKIRVTINAASSLPTSMDVKQQSSELETPGSTPRETESSPETFRGPILVEVWVFRTLLHPLIFSQQLLLSMKSFEKHVESLRTRKVALPELCPIMAQRKRKADSSAYAPSFSPNGIKLNICSLVHDISVREGAALRDLELERKHLVRELIEAEEDGDHEKQAQKRQRLDKCESEKQKIKERYENERQKMGGVSEENVGVQERRPKSSTHAVRVWLSSVFNGAFSVGFGSEHITGPWST